MSRLAVPLFLTTALLLAVVSPASAQLWYVPDYSLPSFGNDAAEAWVGATYGRGLNDASAHVDVMGLLAGMTSSRLVASAGIGHVGEGGGEPTVGFALGVNLLHRQRSRVSLQAAMAHVSFEDIPTPFSARKFPLGVALARSLSSGDSTIEVWVMPKLTLVHTAESVGATRQWGTAVGIWLTGVRGVGIHAALDARFLDDATPWHAGFGFQWTASGIAGLLRTQ